MAEVETIRPSYLLKAGAVEEVTYSPIVLSYSPSINCILFYHKESSIGYFIVSSRTLVQEKHIKEVDGIISFMDLSSDGSFLAICVRSFCEGLKYSFRVVCLGENCYDFDCLPIKPLQSFLLNLDVIGPATGSIMFSPDGSKFFIGTSAIENGVWCRIFTVVEGSQGGLIYSPGSNCISMCYDEIDVYEQGYPLPERLKERQKREADAETDEEYFTLYNQMYYATHSTLGFYRLAISPDTTRLLAGSGDGEIYIIDTNTLKIVQSVRQYEYFSTVTGCHYNPVLGHEEFSTCDEGGFFHIWHVKTTHDEKEEASAVHNLKLEPGTSSCKYSPDGQLIAVTSAAILMVHIICSHSGEIIFNLVYKEEHIITRETYFMSSSLFCGHLCQVVGIHYDNCICFWQLPIIYKLETLCLLLLRSTVRYNDVEKLPLSPPLLAQLKYIYV